MVDFYSSYFGAKKNIVESRIPFEYETTDIALHNPFEFSDYKSDFKVLKSKLKSMDVAVPTLYKQYSELCLDGGIEFHGFNVDPDFSDCIDGFIIVDIRKIKQSKIERYIHNN
jgi:hypothetical protein